MEGGGMEGSGQILPPRPPTGDDAAPGANIPAPKSREERLRDFYSRREQKEQLALPEVESRLASELPPARPPEQEERALRHRQRGNDLYEACDYEAAVEQYTIAIKTASSSVLHSNRAAAYMMLGWWDQALRDTKAALRKDPQSGRALERHGRVLLAQDRLEEALGVAGDMEAALPAEGREAAAQPNAASVKRLRWLAEAARDPSTLDGCREVLAAFGSKAELVSPLGVRLRRRLSELLLARSDVLDNPRRIRPALAKNRRTEADGDEIQEITPYAEEALRVTSELLQDNPEDADLRCLRSRALVRLGRHEEADALLQKGLRLDPEHQGMKELAETVNSLDDIKVKANAFFREGRWNDAIQLYTAGIERDPDCIDTRTVATLHYNRSAAYRKKGEFEKALEDANLCLVLHPKWTKALYRRGILLLECGRPHEALTELKVVQRSDPTFDDDLEDWLRRAHHWMSKARGEKNYYWFMRLPMDASQEEVRKQYHRLCLLWHPDKNGGTEEGRQRFEDLQQAYKFLTNDDLRAQYDFGIWKDRPVRHHVKKREKVKDSHDYDMDNDENYLKPAGWGDKHLEEDDKVESVYWGGQGPPAWLQERRRTIHRQRYGEEPEF